MKKNKLKDRLDKLFADNKDTSLESLEIRNMMVEQILAIIGSTPLNNKSGAVVMTESASAYNPKEYGKIGPRPKAV
jgi:hypothetical protein